MKNNDSLFLAPGAGKWHRFVGVEVVIKAFKSETDQHWSLMEYIAPVGFSGPAPHYHKIMEEGFYVLEGTLTFTLNHRQIEAASGSFVRVPPLTYHAFSNRSDRPARFLVFMSPGGFENYYDELKVLMQSEEGWPPRDETRLTDLLMKYDTYVPLPERR